MESLTPDQIDRAIQLLKEGELVAFPTETVYGLGAPIFNERAIAKIFQAKGRPSDNPLIAHISSLEQVDQIAIDIPPDFYKLAAHYFPGPLTVILKKAPAVSDLVSGGLNTIALRMPNHPLAKALIAGVGQPLVAPSANLSGRPSSTTALHVLSDFSSAPGAVLDGGPTLVGIESTVVNLVTNSFLRPGVITQEEIESVLGRVLRTSTGEGSPGMLYKHYAPKARVLLFTDEALFNAYEAPGLLKERDATSANLYAILRSADEGDYAEIAIYCSEKTLQNKALMDRLTRSERA